MDEPVRGLVPREPRPRGAEPGGTPEGAGKGAAGAWAHGAGTRTDAGGARAGIPGSQADVPGLRTDVPGARADGHDGLGDGAGARGGAGAGVEADRRRRMVKAQDAWWTVLAIDPLAVPMTVWIAHHTRLTPNAVTAIANVIGFGAGLAFLAGWLWLGALLYQVAFLFDCIDGKLARYKGMSSLEGAFLDWMFDRSMDVYAAVTLAVGAWRRSGDPQVLLAGLVWLGLFCIRYLMVQRRHVLLGFGREPEMSVRRTVARRGLARRWLAFCQRHRLYPVPSNIEIFFVTFTLFPLVNRPLGGFWLGAAAFALLSVTGLRTVLQELRRSQGAGVRAED